MASALARICRFARSAALEALVRFEAPEHLRAAHHRFAALFFSWFDQFVIWLVKKSVYNVLGKEKGCIFAARNAWIWPGVINRPFFMGEFFGRYVLWLVLGFVSRGFLEKSGKRYCWNQKEVYICHPKRKGRALKGDRLVCGRSYLRV